MNDYYKSEEHANAQLHVGRRIGIEVARRQFSKAHAEANQIIQHNNQVISLQQQRIVQLEAELASAMDKMAKNAVFASAARDTLEAIVTNNPSTLDSIANVFKAFYRKHVQTAVNLKEIKNDPLSDPDYKATAPKSHTLIMKFLQK